MAVNIDQLRRNQRKGLTVGVVPQDGSTKLRLELDDLLQDADVTNLYLLALIELMKPGVWQDPFSWFQITGIHGKPFEPWDGVTADQVKFPSDQGANTPGNVDPSSGYCSHSSVLFPTWHRAYLTMFEQAIFLKVADIASQYPTGSPYPAAAQRFRIPYWDPFLPRQKTTDSRGRITYKCGIPVIVMIPRILVKLPQSPTKLTEVDNPLYSFKFPPATTKWDTNLPLQWGDGVFPDTGTHNVAKNTIRGIDEKAGASDHLYVIDTFDNALNHISGRGLSLGGKMYRLLHGPAMSYEEMSNTAYNPRPSGIKGPTNFNSLEGWHNDIHVLCGAGRTADNGFYGHMALNEVAGFDPIFWLHHANVDRMIAIWQTLHEKQWWVEQLGNGSNFIEPSGIEEKPSSPLVPFRKQLTDNGPIWWTSDDLRDWTTLGYNYPQIPTKRGDLASLNAWVNEAYEWTTVNGAPQSFEDLLQEQILHPVQVLPEVIKIDGKHLLPDGDLHMRGIPPQRLQIAVKAASNVNGVNGVPQVPITSRFMSMPTEKQATITTKKATPTFEQRFGHLANLVKDGNMTQWNASIRVEKFALNGSFTIFVFLGDFSEDYHSWYHEPNLVGTDSIFANRLSTAAAHCQNCEKQRTSRLLDVDTVPLTTGLLTYWKSGEESKGLKISNLNPDDVIPFLQQNLHWRVVDSRGRNAPRDQVASLKVQVSSQVVHLPQEISDKPVYEEEIVRVEVTDSRPAGLHRGERF